MDDLENKKSSPENEGELEKDGVSSDMPGENNVAQELDDKDFLEAQINELAGKMNAKNEESILKDDVQDWDGLVDDSRQDAEDFILAESSEISDEKIESIEVMEIDEDDERLCSVCHKRLKMTADGVTYEYCRRCRNDFLDTKYNWKSVVTFIVSCVVFVFAVALCAVAMVNALGVKKADSYMEDKKYTSASNAYQTLINSASSSDSAYAPTSFEDLFRVNVGENTIRNYIRSLYYGGDFQTLTSELKARFTEDELAKPKNSEIKTINDLINGLDAVAQKTSNIINALPYNNVSLEDAQKAIDEIGKLKSDKSLNPVFISYYQYYVATMPSNSYDLQLKYLDEMKAAAPDYTIFYLPAYASAYLYTQQYDKCIEVCDEATAINAEDFGITRLKIRALTRQKKYDEALALADSAINAAKTVYTVSADDGTEISPDVTYAYGVYLEQAILYGIKGDMKKAQDAADKSFKGRQTLDSLYLYAMINKKNGNSDAYDEVVSMLSPYNMTIPEVCDEYIEGKKTMEEIIVDGKVEWFG